MPTIPAITAVFAASLGSSGLAGTAVPQLASALASGICSWIPQVVVTTVDVGTLGAGSGGPVPIPLSTPSIFAVMSTQFAAFGLNGSGAPLLLTSLSEGLVLTFAQSFVKTTHTGVGTGTATATFHGPPAVTQLLLALQAAGVNGSATGQFASALGQTIDTVFAGLVMALPVVGSASPTAGSGVGVGQII